MRVDIHYDTDQNAFIATDQNGVFGQGNTPEIAVSWYKDAIRRLRYDLGNGPEAEALHKHCPMCRTRGRIHRVGCVYSDHGMRFHQ